LAASFSSRRKTTLDTTTRRAMGVVRIVEKEKETEWLYRYTSTKTALGYLMKIGAEILRPTTLARICGLTM
jgi:hypothetical protein